MTVCDMHSDTLTKRGAARLFSKYNRSARCHHLQFFAHFVPAQREAAEKRRSRLMKMHSKYLRLSKKEGISNIASPEDLQCAEKGSNNAMSLFSIEGGGGLFADSPELITLFNSGLRILGLAWDKNELCASSKEIGSDDYGLTEKGIALVRKIRELGIIPDLSHMSDRSVFKLFEETETPVLATHSNFRTVCSARRNLADKTAKEIARRGGLIGINIYPPHLSGSNNADKYDIIRHIDYGLSLVGESAIALGLDIDGTGGIYPQGFGESASIHDSLYDTLISEYQSSTLEKIFSTNVLNFLQSNLKQHKR